MVHVKFEAGNFLSAIFTHTHTQNTHNNLVHCIYFIDTVYAK